MSEKSVTRRTALGTSAAALGSTVLGLGSNAAAGGAEDVKWPSEITAKLAKTAIKKKGDQYSLMLVPADLTVTLNEPGFLVWESITKRGKTIPEVIDLVASSAKIPREVASYTVISFLVELRTLGFLTFELPLEQASEKAPLVNSPMRKAYFKVLDEVFSSTPGERWGRTAGSCKTACVN